MERLARFCSSVSYADVSESASEQAKMLVADSIVNILSALSLPVASTLRAYVLQLGGRPEASLVGGKKVPSSSAVLAHAAMASATQWDDTHNESGTHISSAVVPAALALCEQEGLGGRRLIEAVVLGAEVMARTALALGPREVYQKGFHPSSLSAAFGTAAVAGKALGFTPDRFLHAFGLAAVQASGFLCGSEKGPMSWYIQYGRSAESGVRATSLVLLGADAPENAFTDQRGFFHLFSDAPNFAVLGRDLGKSYALESVSKKQFPCFQFGESTLEAFFELRGESPFEPSEVEGIVARIPASAFKQIFLGAKFELPPKTLLSAQTNLRFLLGLAASSGRISLERLVAERESPSVLEMARKVTVVGDEELNRIFPGTWPARVEVQLKGRGELARTVLHPKGDWRNPMGWEDLHRKFSEQVPERIGPRAAERLWDRLLHLETLKDTVGLLPRRVHC